MSIIAYTHMIFKYIDLYYATNFNVALFSLNSCKCLISFFTSSLHTIALILSELIPSPSSFLSSVSAASLTSDKVPFQLLEAL